MCGKRGSEAPGVERKLARDALHRVFSKLACREAAENRVDSEREVRWMASGSKACSIPACVPLVEAVHARTGVPVREQRLFVDGEELASDAMLSSATASSPVLLVRSVSDPRITDLTHFHVARQFEEVPCGVMTFVRKIAEGINGDIFRYRWQRDQDQKGEDIAVKKLRNASMRRTPATQSNERRVHFEPWKNAAPAEDALAEIGVMSYLSKQPDCSQYLLRMLGCFADRNHTWLVTEFAEGGESFTMVSSQALSQDTMRRYSWELLQAVAFLHRHQIGHRDISLENILVKDDSVKLMDFGLAVRSHSSSGTPLRYFRPAGKNFYRAPECYVPLIEQVQVVGPTVAASGDVVMLKTCDGYLCEVRLPTDCSTGKQCMADVWGYTVQPADIFSLGMSICVLYCGFPLWQKAMLTDATFAYVHRLKDNGLASLLRRWQKPLLPAEVMQLLTGMLRTDDPSKRLAASECLQSSLFQSLR